MQSVTPGLALGCLLHLFPPPCGSIFENRRSACHIADHVLPAQLSMDEATRLLLGRAGAHLLPTLAAIATAADAPVRMHAGAQPALGGAARAAGHAQWGS